jgi:hypothetical protein
MATPKAALQRLLTLDAGRRKGAGRDLLLEHHTTGMNVPLRWVGL